jgi:anti-sigma regulatory factor (Ser/Thr protein kinase)
MADRNARLTEINSFILDEVEAHPQDIARLTATTFGISRQSVAKHLRRLVSEGLLMAVGKTRARRYRLKTIIDHSFSLEVTPMLAEDVEWRQKILPLMNGVRENVKDICHYGFTEMVNNVIDHSEAKDATIAIRRTARSISLMVLDEGVGIFNKLQRSFGLDDPRHALLELSKGKLTSDPDSHTGEGIFFTSRMFDEFMINSGTMLFKRFNKLDDDWFIEITEHPLTEGTMIVMTIHPQAAHTTKEIFDKFADGVTGFSRTHVPIQMALYEGDKLISRSQARRILARVERFNEVLLDFRGVTEIGQAFADEIFRVFHREHPEIILKSMFTNPDIDRMIERVTVGARAAAQPALSHPSVHRACLALQRAGLSPLGWPALQCWQRGRLRPAGDSCLSALAWPHYATSSR